MDDPDRAVFSEYHGHGTRASAYMIRRGKWKLLHYCAAPHQLFDLEADPDELNNLAGEHTDMVKKLEKELGKICSPDAEDIRAEHFIQKQLKAIRLGHAIIGP